MVRRALYKETPENEPQQVFFHGFFPETFLTPPDQGPQQLLHKPIAIIEDEDGTFASVDPACVKLHPATHTIAEATKKARNNSQIIKPFEL